MDLFIQDNFFNLPWQLAFVYDPIGGDEGSFVWRAGKSDREPFLVDETMTPEEARAGAADARPAATSSAEAPGAAPATFAGMQRRTAWMVAGLIFIASFVIAGLVLAVR
jgi:hypothetical protein